MQAVHGFSPVAGKREGQRGQTLVQRALDGFLFGLARAAQHVIDHLLRFARVANPNAQAVKLLLVAQGADDIAQPVVAAVSAAGFIT